MDAGRNESMNKWIVIFIFICFLIYPICVTHADDSRKIRAVSLKVLQQESSRSCKTNGSCPEVISKMASLTKITGYIIDKKNRDIILVGEVDSDLSPILLEDFVVALRNAWLKYAVLKGRAHYYSNPGCSIDPDPLTITRLKAIKFKNSDPDNALKEWDHICRSPQTVRVIGIPFDSHFAFVMVKADYDMKRIVNGSDQLGIEGFNSLMDRRMEIHKEEILRKENTDRARSSMNRFWFYPDENKYWEDAGIVNIEQSKVILLTEEEFLDHQGTIVGKNRPDPLAKEFCEDFGKRYSDISEKRPIYSELENLFNLVTIAKIIKAKSSNNEAGLNLTYLVEKYHLPHHNVERQLPGLSCVKEYKYRKEYSDGYEIYHSALQSCGGVGIEINVNKKQFTKDKSGKLRKVRAVVLSNRPSQSTLYWDVANKQAIDKEKLYWDMPLRDKTP